MGDKEVSECARRRANGSSQASGVLPRLEGACVAVIGADATTPNGIAVREFWQQYFEAAGASLDEDNYRLIATDRGALRC